MTVNAFLEFFNFENSIQSSEKINYGEIEIPKYALEHNRNIRGGYLSENFVHQFFLFSHITPHNNILSPSASLD